MRPIRFYLNDQYIERPLNNVSETVLGFLREDANLRGTKEGCAEGDCGACTVLVGQIRDDKLCYHAMNACIAPLALVDGAHVVTIESLAENEPNWIQLALIEANGSQCGFCTPGIVMSLYALWLNNPNPKRVEIETALQGNLCRCTGYQSILQAILQAANSQNLSKDKLIVQQSEIYKQLLALDLLDPNLGEAWIPRSMPELLESLRVCENPRFITGATDVGLLITKRFTKISPAIFLSNVKELKNIEISDQEIKIGAAVTYTEAMTILDEVLPDLKDFWPRIAGQQIRNMGSLGGNIANGSPIGDMAPVLIALGARIRLRSQEATREIPLESFFIAYGKQDRAVREFVETLIVPRQKRLFFAEKVSKRRDEDISTLSFAMSFGLKDGRIIEPRVAFGGMAATPKRASHFEAAVSGEPLSEVAIRSALHQLDHDFSPISDARASMEYRAKVAKNLILRTVLSEDRPSL